jgi:hypothetical protein
LVYLGNPRGRREEREEREIYSSSYCQISKIICGQIILQIKIDKGRETKIDERRLN